MLKFALCLALLAGTAPALAADDPNLVRARAVLKAQPIIDGHNDWAEQLRGQFGEK